MHQRHYSVGNTLPFFLLVLGGLLLFNSCGLFQANTNLGELAKVIEMSKGPCYGPCPVFTITVYEKGVVAYKGERYSDKLGLYVKVLKKAEYNQLVNDFAGANLWQYQDVYKSQIPDLQTVTLTYYEEGDIKTIVGKDGRPSAVLELEEKLDLLAAQDGWEQKEKPTYGLPDNVKPDELIVQFIDNVDPNTWVRKYAKQEMKVIKSMQNDRFWLVQFNKDIMPPREMIEFVRRDDYVVSAQFNLR